jgi:hypothetical protein
MRFCSTARALACSALLLAVSNAATRAQNNPVLYRDVETKYIFGFTEGSGIGLEGEREVSAETIARIGKRDGRYSASETKLEYEFTPNQYVQFEFGPRVSWHNIQNATDLDDRSRMAFSGFFGEIRYLLLDRTSSQPLAVTISAEPEWHRNDETSGARVTNLGFEVKLNVDLELIQNQLYLGANLFFEPEATRDPDGVGAGWLKESTGGISGALAYRIAPAVFVGAEAWYLRHYDGSWFNSFTGDALFVGPTLYVQLTRKMFMTAAWNTQVWGREVDNPGVSFNLAEFSRQRAKLKVAVEF